MKTKKTNSDSAVAFHSEIANDFHASYSFDRNRLERVEVWNALFNKHATSATSAYDIGCGTGVLACELAKRGIDTIGVDGADGMLAVAKKYASDGGHKNISFQQHILPISDTSKFKPADLVISSSVIEYLESIPEALDCLRNLATPGGRIIFSVSNRNSISRKLVRLVHHLTGRPRYFGLLRHFMTIEDIKRDLKLAKLDYIEHIYFGRADLLNQLFSLLLPAKFSSNMIAVVAKS